ncbi:MAG: hypothetical protein KF729_05290 [Sandaracinaceae bacterium]|nr:hypothetical protein [Sandaracinaceae bacterium]
MKPLVWLALAGALASCGGDAPPGGSDSGARVDGAPPADGDGGGSSDGSTPSSDGGGLDAGDTPSACAPGARRCASAEREARCEDGAWVEGACAAGTRCVEDACVAACLDACALGETRAGASGPEACVLVGEGGARVAPGEGGHDRARRHLAWLRRHHLANGYVANAAFEDTARTRVARYTGTVDAAEWTGAYLAAEALRAMVTRSPDALENVDAIVERIHQLFEVTGTPGSMARIWAPLGADPRLTALYDAGDRAHFETTYRGGRAFYHAWTSRDMYAGVSLGLGLAYDATRSEAHRELIRDVIVTLARELAQARRVPVRVRYHAFGSWQRADLDYELENVVLVPNEMEDGRVLIRVGSEASPSDYDASELFGVREFMPDLRRFLAQTPLVGAAAPSVPRPGSALMLAHFMELALHVTDGVPGRAADRAAIRAYYDANRASWLGVMRQYTYHGRDECWLRYFGMTIAYHPTYGILRLTRDASFRDALRAEVLGGGLRRHVMGHANAYFDFVAAAQGTGLIGAAELSHTVEELLGFPLPPKASSPVDLRGRYPEDASCGQSTTPVRVRERVPRDFMWQHHPFQLVSVEDDPRHVFPGTDYLLAYWLGRHHGFVADDAPGTCTAWARE